MKKSDVQGTHLKVGKYSDGAAAAIDPSQLPNAVAHKLSSAAILSGHTELQIDHNGEVYRLRRTRLGKLILTK